MALLVVVFTLGLWAWTQRYDLMESRVVKVFEEAGLEAELDIVSISSTQAQISDILLRRGDEDVLRIEALRADYVWPDVRDGRLIHLDVEGAAAKLELDKNWRLSDESWVKALLPDGAGDGDGGDPLAKFSEKGIRLSSSTLTLVSPLGEQTFQLDADMASFEDFKAKITLPSSDLSYGGYLAKGAGVVMLEGSGGEIQVQGQTQTESLSNAKNKIEAADLRWDGIVNLKSRSYAGVVSADGQKVSTELFSAEPARLSWDGAVNLNARSYEGKFFLESQKISGETFVVEAARISGDGAGNLDSRSYDGKLAIESGGISSDLFGAKAARITWDGEASNADDVLATGRWAKGRWSVSADQARTTRTARAGELAETLSLFPALSVVPVTEYYAPDLKQTVEAFFLGADVKGEGDLDYDPAGFKLTPDGAMRVQAANNNLRLLPRAGADFFAFDAGKQSILAQMDATFDNPVGLTLTGIELRAKSKNGVSLGGVERFSAKLETTENWTARDEDNRSVRLGPLSTFMEYTGGVNPRKLSIDTALDYDGSLPGGRVEGLNLEGRIDVRLYEGRQVLDFTPLDNSRITLTSMETPTAWLGQNMSFNLAPTTNLFTRTATESTLAARLEMADFTLTQPAKGTTEAQRLDVQSAALNLNGTLFPNRTQDWSVGFEDVNYASDTLPGPGTQAVAKAASLTARLMPDQSPQITLNSPSVTTETPLARLSDFEIALTGTPDIYSIEHSGGSVDVVGDQFSDLAEMAGLSSFPANGRVEFVDGRFVGKANLVVAKADDAAVTVAYEFANGAGIADIDIPSILFTPQGLQPQNLVPAFSGKIAQVEGEARAKFKIAFADGEVTDSSGRVQLVDTALGTAPGPITGLNTTMNFASLWPLETDGRQTLKLESFNPGMALEDGVLTYNLVPDGVQVFSADWPIGNGSFSLDPFTWLYGAEENRVTMRIKNVALGDFLNDLGNRKVKATGNVVGEFPIVVRGIEVLIEEGRLSVPDGGVITYDPGPNVPTYSEEEAIAVLRQRRTSEYASLAQDALRKFRYKELSATIDGPLEGDVEIGLVFDGSNAKVLNRQPFRFDISVRGELFNIARSFNSNAQVKSEILRQNGALPEGTIVGE